MTGEFPKISISGKILEKAFNCDREISMTSPKALLGAWNLRPRKNMGQHFLSDPGTSEKIVGMARISPEHTILEIGPGLGALTIPAARVAKRVHAVDKDPHLIALLEAELLARGLSNVVLRKQDILTFDIMELAENTDQNLLVMGNLPYNISSQVLVQLIHSRSFVSRAVLMFQKELARRLMAQPGGRDYGRLTVMLRYCSDIRSLMTVKAPLFFPAPRVDSEVVEIKFRYPEFPAEDEVFLFKVIKAAFGQRRKTLRNALAGSELRIDAKTALRALEKADIDPSRRAETLAIQEFVRLSRCL